MSKKFMNEEAASHIMLGMPDPYLPDPDGVSYFKLEEKRIIYIDYEIDETLYAVHRMILRWNIEDFGLEPEKRKPIILVVQSYGGEIDAMKMLINIITESRTPVYTVNVGVAASAASLIFMSGHKKFMSRYATVTIHEGSASLSGDAGKLMDATDSYKKVLNWMKDYILNHSEIPKKELMKKRLSDWELSVEDCVKYKVTDYVIDSIDDVLEYVLL